MRKHKNIHLLGRKPYDELPRYVAGIDVCINPYILDDIASGCSPLKLYEYMACAKPVVASRVCGFEVLESVGAGLLVSPDDPEELAGAVVSLLKDEGLREEMGKNGREYVVKSHSWESVAKRVLEVCESAASRG